MLGLVIHTFFFIPLQAKKIKNVTLTATHAVAARPLKT